MIVERFEASAREWVQLHQAGCWEKLRALAKQVKGDIGKDCEAIMKPGIAEVMKANARVLEKRGGVAAFSMEYARGLESEAMEAHKLLAAGVRLGLLLAIVFCDDAPKDLQARLEKAFDAVEADTMPFEALRNCIVRVLENPQLDDEGVEEFWDGVVDASIAIQDAYANLFEVFSS